MRKNAIETFPGSAVRGSSGQGGSKEPLESGHDTLGLPSLAIDPPRKPALHLATIATVDATLVAAGVHGDDGGSDAQHFATKPMDRFRVIGSVGQDTVDGEVVDRLPDGGLEIGRIVTRPQANPGGPDEVRSVVADEGQFGPAPVLFCAALAMQEVPADVMTFQPGGVNAGLGLPVQQAKVLGDTENGPEQSIKSPFFRSRCSA